MAESVLECPICLSEIEHPVMPPCQHAFCYSCISRYTKKTEAKCPICRASFDDGDLRRCLQIEQMLSAKNSEPTSPCRSDGYPKSFDFGSKPQSQQAEALPNWASTLGAAAVGVLVGAVGAAIGYNVASKRRK
ncbi:Postreplication repair E3 ubiquitin-protein ligase rad18 [Taenia crassiceps]